MSRSTPSTPFAAVAAHFDEVVATDLSIEQLAAAPAHPRVLRVAATAEHSGLAPRSVSLVAVAQALHWFDLTAFLAEAAWVLRPAGVLAAWSYARPRVDAPRVQACIDWLHDDALGEYWDFDRAAVESGYRGWPIFSRPPRSWQFMIARNWNVAALLGYLGTWSALSVCRAAGGGDPLAAVAPRLRAAWGEGQRRVGWAVTLRAGWPAAA